MIKAPTFTYEEAHRIMTEYMLYKMSIGDHHGTSDAANDLRVLEAQHKKND
jgi:hypothetical protein